MPKIYRSSVEAETQSFISFQPDANKLVYDDSEVAVNPTAIYTFSSPQGLLVGGEVGSVYGYVRSGILRLMKIDTGRVHEVMSGEYFSANDQVRVSGEASGILVVRMKEKVLNVLGGPIEEEGRLRCIDGCTDTLLIPPVKWGMSCLNHLHFPANTRQTMHTHPTVRAGIVAKGEGLCHTPFGDLALREGMPFVILPNDGYTDGRHCFNTYEAELDVIAYHPDSDFGPRDEDHPMLNRTFIDGISAGDAERQIRRET